MQSQTEVATEAATIRSVKSLYATAAALSFLVSVGLWFSGSKEAGLYVGLWVPSILSAGAFMLAGAQSWKP